MFANKINKKSITVESLEFYQSIYNVYFRKQQKFVTNVKNRVAYRYERYHSWWWL